MGLKSGVWAIFIIAVIWACEESREPIDRDPTISILFINKDSLDHVNLITDSLEEELLANDVELVELNGNSTNLADSLITLTDLIANGENLSEERDQVIHDLDTLETFIAASEEADSTLNVRYKEWLEVISKIEDGNVKVLSIENLKNNEKVFYEDSSTNWFLPLDMNADDIDVNINLDDIDYRYVLKYNRWTQIDEFGRVKIRTSGFEVVYSDFDSTYVSCVKCIDNQTYLYVEF